MKKNYLLLKIFWVLFVSFNILSCSSGLQVNACVVDGRSMGFQCIDSQKKKSFISFAHGGKLKCASPSDTEDYLKACKERKVIKVTLCNVEKAAVADWIFSCTPPIGASYNIGFEDAENFFCLTDHDRKRLEERCLASGMAGLEI